MPELMIVCPNKGKEIATGIEVSVTEPRKAARLFVRCPHCGILHGCSPNEGYVKETPVAGQQRPETLAPHARTQEEPPAQTSASHSQWVVEA